MGGVEGGGGGGSEGGGGGGGESGGCSGGADGGSHGSMLQSSVSVISGQPVPPHSHCCVTVRMRLWVPPPQLSVQLLQGCQPETLHSRTLFSIRELWQPLPHPHPPLTWQE